MQKLENRIKRILKNIKMSEKVCENILGYFISSNQTGYVNGRFIRKSGYLASNILKHN